MLKLANMVTSLMWQNVPAIAQETFEICRQHLPQILDKTAELRERDDFRKLFYSPGSDCVYVQLSDGSDTEAWKQAFAGDTGFKVSTSLPSFSEVWAPIAFKPGTHDVVKVKEATSKVLNNLGKLTLNIPSDTVGDIPFLHGPVAGLLGGALLGSSLGYGAGWLGERVLPQDWERKKLRRTMAMLGGLTGATPGLLLMLDNKMSGRNLNSDAIFPAKGLEEKVAQLYDAQSAPFSLAINSNPFGSQPINVPYMQRTLMYDPYVTAQLSPGIRGTAAGLLGVSQIDKERREGISTSFIWPRDIARITAGMGTGYFSGALVGKVLGALTGMPQTTQDKLKQVGLWSGVVANVLPLAFGR